MQISLEDTPLSSVLENYIEKFKVIYADTLFTPNWEALEKDHCPFCGFKLYEMRDRPLWHCKTNRHKKFIIRDKVKTELCLAFQEKREKKAEWERRREEWRNTPYPTTVC